MSLLKKMVIRFSVSVVQLLTIFSTFISCFLIDRLFFLSIIGNITTWQMIFYIFWQV
jgi:hypothetical protein